MGNSFKRYVGKNDGSGCRAAFFIQKNTTGWLEHRVSQ